MKTLAYAIATWFGCGFVPKAPGTVGSLVALVIVCSAGFSLLQIWIAAAILFFPAVWSTGVVAKHRGVADPQIVVVDEVLGQWIALAGAPRFSWLNAALAFVLFRVFDIFKPPPARQAERLPGGWGIIADDVVAGLYAALVLRVWGWFNLG